jgi:hypothetical protein
MRTLFLSKKGIRLGKLRFGFKGANKILRSHSAEVLGRFVVAQRPRYLQAQFGLRTEIAGVLHGRFSRWIAFRLGPG